MTNEYHGIPTSGMFYGYESGPPGINLSVTERRKHQKHVCLKTPFLVALEQCPAVQNGNGDEMSTLKGHSEQDEYLKFNSSQPCRNTQWSLHVP